MNLISARVPRTCLTNQEQWIFEIKLCGAREKDAEIRSYSEPF